MRKEGNKKKKNFNNKLRRREKNITDNKAWYEEHK